MASNSKWVSLSAVGSLLVAMQGVALAHDWPQLGLDGSRARASGELSGTPFRPAWRVQAAAGPIVSSPMVVDGYVVVAGSTGELRALHAFDGAEAWSVKAAGPLGASPAIERGRLFVSTLNGRVQALRLADGHQLWQRSFGGQNYGSPAIVGDSLVLAAGFPAQKLARLGLADGATRWETAPGAVADLVNSSPAVAANQVVFGMNGGRYQSVDLGTGATTWKIDTAGSVSLSAPLLAGDTAYFVPGGSSPALFAVNSATGQSLPGWPVAVTDPSLPAGKVLTRRHAVSSPTAVGNLIVFQIRFEYGVQDQTAGVAGHYELNEYAVAVDPQTQAVAWQRQTGARTAATVNQIPELNLSPTPASFGGAAGALVAVSSSVSPSLHVLDAATGIALWTTTLSAPTRSSPVFANGLLLVATEAGTVHAFESVANQAPLAPAVGFAPADGQLVDSASPTLSWAAAHDAQGQPLQYQVRIDTDGEVLENWLTELRADGQPQVAVPHGLLAAGGSYVYAVRSRDAQGAWSGWSAAQGFTVAINPKVAVGGTEYDSLEQAIMAAAPGSTISVGRGMLRLSRPLQLPAGLSLVGAGPHDTILDATGLPAGIQVSARGRTGATKVEGVTVTGAETCVQVYDVEKASLRNLVVRDCKLAGIEVEIGASAEAMNLTLVRNGAGAVAHGTLAIRNSIITENDIGLARAGDGKLTSRYNDLVANRTAGYQGVEPGTGDISAAVRFAAAARQDFHLQGLQVTTDQGDPADEFANEPAPNGGRVNMGAFANTANAELSAATQGFSTTDDTGANEPAGCSMGGSKRPSAAWAILAIGLLLVIRRRK
jgi:MYXO-CTERM domain-containing protein